MVRRLRGRAGRAGRVGKTSMCRAGKVTRCGQY